jgi:hypothetical protein
MEILRLCPLGARSSLRPVLSVAEGMTHVRTLYYFERQPNRKGCALSNVTGGFNIAPVKMGQELGNGQP